MPTIEVRTPRLETLPLYRFGSPELSEMHRRAKTHDGTYGNGLRYVVFHPAVNGGAQFHTLNTACFGQRVPSIQDLVPDADGVLTLAQCPA